MGYGGAGILFPAVRVTERNGLCEEDKMWVALKECFPVGTDRMLDRDEKGGICCVSKTHSYAGEYYDYAKEMLRREKKITGEIFNRGFRLTPIWSMAEREEISFDGEVFHPAENQYGIMERMDEKGVSLGNVLKEQEGGCLTAYQSICVLEQILQAIDEVHRNGYLHGDIQENNIFLKGIRFEESVVTLIDFGSARAFLEDGATAMITDRKLYSTSGYSAPECSTGNDGILRLTRAADLSVSETGEKDWLSIGQYRSSEPDSEKGPGRKSGRPLSERGRNAGRDSQTGTGSLTCEERDRVCGL